MKISFIRFFLIIGFFTAKGSFAMGNNGEISSDRALYIKASNVIRYYEGESKHIYLDVLGVPTIGIGAALGGMKNNTIILHKLSKINNLFYQAGIKDMPRDVYNTLVSITNRINNGYSVKKGVINKLKNKFSLTKPEKNRLFDISLMAHMKELEISADRYNVDLSILSQHAKLAIVDLFYRGGDNLVLGRKTPKINQALRSRDYTTLAFEICYDSNADKLHGNDVRNVFYCNLILEQHVKPSVRLVNKYNQLRVDNSEVVETVNNRYRTILIKMSR